MEVFIIFHQIPSYLNAYAPGPFPKKEGERGSVVKEKTLPASSVTVPLPI